MNKGSIGIFDSGVGGTSIWKEIQTQLPFEDTIYLADSKHAPYGEKSKEEIIRLSIKNTELLLQKGCKIIVVACNTATTNAIAVLREKYKVPFIGIEPAIKPAALQSKSKVVGVLATKGTLSSSLFHSTSENHANGIKIIEQVGTGLVSLVEQGKQDKEETKKLLQTLLEPMLKADIDCLVLGCTHYPYLIPILEKLLTKAIKIIDSGAAVARQTKKMLTANSLLSESKKTGTHQFYSNKDCGILKELLKNSKVANKIDYLDF